MMSLMGPDVDIPDWMDRAARYYSMIEDDRRDSVRLMGDATEKTPGTLRLRLVAAFRRVRVLDAAGQEIGLIRPRPPGLGFTMRRGGSSVWTVSSRSLVMRRHALTFSNGDRWNVHTPFYWWRNIVAEHGGATHVLGQVGHIKRFWLLWVEPGRDDHDLLAALAFMHRRWWRH